MVSFECICTHFRATFYNVITLFSEKRKENHPSIGLASYSFCVLTVLWGSASTHAAKGASTPWTGCQSIAQHTHTAFILTPQGNFQSLFVHACFLDWENTNTDTECAKSIQNSRFSSRNQCLHTVTGSVIQLHHGQRLRSVNLTTIRIIFIDYYIGMQLIYTAMRNLQPGATVQIMSEK